MNRREVIQAIPASAVVALTSVDAYTSVGNTKNLVVLQVNNSNRILNFEEITKSPNQISEYNIDDQDNGLFLDDRRVLCWVDGYCRNANSSNVFKGEAILSWTKNGSKRLSDTSRSAKLPCCGTYLTVCECECEGECEGCCEEDECDCDRHEGSCCCESKEQDSEVLNVFAPGQIGWDSLRMNKFEIQVAFENGLVTKPQVLPVWEEQVRFLNNGISLEEFGKMFVENGKFYQECENRKRIENLEKLIKNQKNKLVSSKEDLLKYNAELVELKSKKKK